MLIKKEERNAFTLLQDLHEEVKKYTNIDELQRKLKKALESRGGVITEAVWLAVSASRLFCGSPLASAVNERYVKEVAPSPKRQKLEAPTDPPILPVKECANPPCLPFTSGWFVDVGCILDLCRYKLSDVFLFGAMLFLVSRKTGKPVYHIPGTNASKLVSFVSPYGDMYYCLLGGFLPAYVIFAGSLATFFLLETEAYKAMSVNETSYFDTSLETCLSAAPDFKRLSSFVIYYDDADSPFLMLGKCMAMAVQVRELQNQDFDLRSFMVSKLKYFKSVVEHRYDATNMDHIITTHLKPSWGEVHVSEDIRLDFCLALCALIDICACDYRALQAERDSAVNTLFLMEAFRKKLQHTLKQVMELVPVDATNKQLLDDAKRLAEI